MQRISPVVLNLIILNVILYFGIQYLLPYPQWKEYFYLCSPSTGHFHPVQIITHMFNHADEQHLIFNMMSLYFIGPYVEQILGQQRFLILYFLSGIIAGIAQLLLTTSCGLGASGAVFGVTAAFATMLPNMEMQIMFIPVPIKAKYLAIGLVLLGLYFGISGQQAGIGHFAHVGGAIVGFLCIKYWKLSNLR